MGASSMGAQAKVREQAIGGEEAPTRHPSILAAIKNKTLGSLS